MGLQSCEARFIRIRLVVGKGSSPALVLRKAKRQKT